MKPFHRKRISWLYFSFKWLEMNSSYMGNNLKSIFFLILPASRRQVTKISQMKDFCLCSVTKMLFFIFIFALIVIMLFVQTMHSLCLWPLVSTTESFFFFFFYSPSYIGLFCFPFFFFKSSKYVTWTISVKIYQYACRSSALLLLFFPLWCSTPKFNFNFFFFRSLSR